MGQWSCCPWFPMFHYSVNLTFNHFNLVLCEHPDTIRIINNLIMSCFYLLLFLPEYKTWVADGQSTFCAILLGQYSYKQSALRLLFCKICKMRVWVTVCVFLICVTTIIVLSVKALYFHKWLVPTCLLIWQILDNPVTYDEQAFPWSKSPVSGIFKRLHNVRIKI